MVHFPSTPYVRSYGLSFTVQNDSLRSSRSPRNGSIFDEQHVELASSPNIGSNGKVQSAAFLLGDDSSLDRTIHLTRGSPDLPHLLIR